MVGGQVVVFHKGGHLHVGTYAGGVFTLTPEGEAHLKALDETVVLGAPEGPGDEGKLVVDTSAENAATQVQPIRSDPVEIAEAKPVVEAELDELLKG